MSNYKLKGYINKESLRESFEYEANKLRKEADILIGKAQVMDEMARKIFFSLELLEGEEVSE